MTDQEQIVQGYKTVDAKMTAMLAHAQLEQWDEVVSLGEQYLADIERLTELEKDIPAATDEQDPKLDIIRQILSSESNLRDLLTSTMDELSESTAELEKQRDVSGYYSSV